VYVQSEFGLGSQQLLAQFNKIIRKVSQYIDAEHKAAVEKEIIAALPDERLAMLRAESTAQAQRAKRRLDDELIEGGKRVKSDLKAQQEALLANLGTGVSQYAIEASDADFEQAAQEAKQRGVALPQSISLKKAHKEHASGSSGSSSAVKRKDSDKTHSAKKVKQ
jgi:hypothetical protein